MKICKKYDWKNTLCRNIKDWDNSVMPGSECWVYHKDRLGEHPCSDQGLEKIPELDTILFLEDL